MSATLPTNFNPIHAPTAAELGQILSAITRITNIATATAIGTAGLAGSTSATYVDVTGTSQNWTKNGDSSSSDVLVVVAISCYVSVAATGVMFGVKIGSTDYDTVAMIVNPINTHTPLVGGKTITGVAAGAYTPNIRFKRQSGTGAVTVDSGDSAFLLLVELPK